MAGAHADGALPLGLPFAVQRRRRAGHQRERRRLHGVLPYEVLSTLHLWEVQICLACACVRVGWCGRVRFWDIAEVRQVAASEFAFVEGTSKTQKTNQHVLTARGNALITEVLTLGCTEDMEDGAVPVPCFKAPGPISTVCLPRRKRSAWDAALAWFAFCRRRSSHFETKQFSSWVAWYIRSLPPPSPPQWILTREGGHLFLAIAPCPVEYRSRQLPLVYP